MIRRIKTTSKRQAKAALAELEIAIAAGRVSSDDPTLGQLLERCLDYISADQHAADVVSKLLNDRQDAGSD